MNNGSTELVFILDKSGSMAGLESDTIGGFNSMLGRQRDASGECTITTVLFDNNYELLHDRIDIKAVSPMTQKEYQVGGTTALLDAVGRTINKIAGVQKNTAEEYRAKNVMFVIITDGRENSSVEFSQPQIKSMIERQKEKYNWEFVFLGANIDAVKTAASYGIAADHAADWIADSVGAKLSYNAMSDAVMGFRSCGVVAPEHFDALRKDVKKRKKR